MLCSDCFLEHQIVAFLHAEASVNLLGGKVGLVGIQADLRNAAFPGHLLQCVVILYHFPVNCESTIGFIIK